jgi:hypothetical protein
MPGHVFLVHGHLDKLSCDAWLVPSGNKPHPGSAWQHAVSSEPPPNTPDQRSKVVNREQPKNRRHKLLLALRDWSFM